MMMTEQQRPSNCILYDWLTFSSSSISDPDEIIRILGLSDHPWQKELGSRLRYDERWQIEGFGISVHFSYPDSKRNEGVCVEMSGQGCRAFETWGACSFDDLIKWIIDNGFNISRLDIAYDDFEGLIDIKSMYGQALRREFRCRSEHLSLYFDGVDRDSGHDAISVCHGKRDSHIFIRCYDKRAERKAFDEFPHWVRLEMQLRNENAMGFASASGSIGQKFRSVLCNYLNYLDPDPDDSNYRRWEVSSWWVNLLDGAAAISIVSKKDIDYNRERLNDFVYNHCANAIKAAVALDGGKKFFENILFCASSDLKPKYARLLEDERKRLLDLKILNEKKYFSSLGLSVSEQVDSLWSDFCRKEGFSDV